MSNSIVVVLVMSLSTLLNDKNGHTMCPIGNEGHIKDVTHK